MLDTFSQTPHYPLPTTNYPLPMVHSIIRHMLCEIYTDYVKLRHLLRHIYVKIHGPWAGPTSLGRSRAWWGFWAKFT